MHTNTYTRNENYTKTLKNTLIMLAHTYSVATAS